MPRKDPPNASPQASSSTMPRRSWLHHCGFWAFGFLAFLVASFGVAVAQSTSDYDGLFFRQTKEEAVEVSEPASAPFTGLTIVRKTLRTAQFGWPFPWMYSVGEANRYQLTSDVDVMGVDGPYACRGFVVWPLLGRTVVVPTMIDGWRTCGMIVVCAVGATVTASCVGMAWRARTHRQRAARGDCPRCGYHWDRAKCSECGYLPKAAS
jgi:hypothetical protein